MQSWKVVESIKSRDTLQKPALLTISQGLDLRCRHKCLKSAMEHFFCLRQEPVPSGEPLYNGTLTVRKRVDRDASNRYVGPAEATDKEDLHSPKKTELWQTNTFQTSNLWRHHTCEPWSNLSSDL